MTIPKYRLDFETRSSIDLKVVGAHRYARHESTSILCLAYSTPSNPEPICLTTEQVQNGAFIPVVNEFLTGGKGFIVAHNASFEQQIYQHVLVERFGYPSLYDPALWNCTMARALACGLPAKLEKLAEALGLSVQKDMAGNRAMMKLSKPRGIDPLGDAYYWEDEELYKSLYSYCCTDVAVEMLADERLPELSPEEHKVWVLDQKINRRGVRIDVAAAAKGAMLADALIGPLNKRLEEITGGAVKKATQVSVLKKYLEEEEGIPVGDGMDKNAVEDLLKDKTISPVAREALTIRQQVSKTSTKKFISMMAVADPHDSRARGLLQYSGAATGRWAGRLLQPHNFPKIPKGLDMGGTDKEKEEKQGRIIMAMMEGSVASFLKSYGSQSMDVLSAVLRGMIVAEEGKKLAVADFSAIEARVVLWLAGDEEALQMFREGKSLYLAMAEFIFKRQGITKKDELEYQLGKRIILAAGYGMGYIKFMGSCAQDGLIVEENMAKMAIKAYREKYRSVVQTWYATEAAAVKAVREPGSVNKCCDGKIAYGMDKKREYLIARLPSGRFLRYYRPSISRVSTPWGEKDEIRYWTSDMKGGLSQFKVYGGLLVENNTQAIARDLMVNAMTRSEEAGYENILTVHDEVVAEVSDKMLASGVQSFDKFNKIMCDIPVWATGCPVASEGYLSRRYRKG